MYEGVSDAHGWGASGQLISTMFQPNAYPEMYKYTFPDQILMDMMNPRRNSGMRAEHIARKSTFLLFRAFVCGSYLWVYDLEEDNTFRRDPDQLARLKRVIALRQAWLNAYGHGRFVDTVDLLCEAPNAMAKRYRLENAQMIACARENGLRGARFGVKWTGDAPRAYARTSENPGAETEISVKMDMRAGAPYALVELEADAELAVIVFRPSRPRQDA